MLELKNLKLAYDDNEILKGIDLTVDKGEVVTFIGPSGTGKTTILKCINYLVSPYEGEIEISGLNLNYKKVSRKEILQLRRKTAMVFQHSNIFKNKTVLENVMEPQVIAHKKSKKEAYEKSIIELERVGLLNKKDVYPSKLSGGQLQRVGIARALAVNPEVILFDEPTSALDPELVDEVLSVIEEVAKTGVTILLVTHEMEFAKNLSNRIVFMDQGKVVESGTPDQIFHNSENERTQKFLKKFYCNKSEDSKIKVLARSV